MIRGVKQMKEQHFIPFMLYVPVRLICSLPINKVYIHIRILLFFMLLLKYNLQNVGEAIKLQKYPDVTNFVNLMIVFSMLFQS